MVPGGLRKVADGVDHHQRTLPARGAESASDPAVFVAPVGEIAFEPRLDLVWRIDPLFRIFAHCAPPISKRPSLHQRTAPLVERPKGGVCRNRFNEIIDVEPALRLL